MRTCAAWCMTMVLAVCASAWAAVERVYDQRFFEPTEEVVTPAVVWARPLAGGPVKVLWITHRNAMREPVELNQRLDMQYKVFACETTGSSARRARGWMRRGD